MTQATTLVWFRQDLRIQDNPALFHACQHGTVIPVFIWDEQETSDWPMGGACRWWLHQSLEALNQQLQGKLCLLKGDTQTQLSALLNRTGARAVYWNRGYEPWRMSRDSALKTHFQGLGITTKSFNGHLLWEPWEVSKADGTPYKVFTPFYRKGCLNASPPRDPYPAADLSALRESASGVALEALGLLPTLAWYTGMAARWTPGETGARERLGLFLHDKLSHYQSLRDFPASDAISGLSPHLRFGEVSPQQVWHAAHSAGFAQHAESALDKFCAELGWREFSYSLLYHNPQLPTENLQPLFNHFAWATDRQDGLRAWQTGNTGFPLIDAGMRELWQTGFMHNRVRMVTASFLVKNLRIDWREGARWFWDCLVDADLANNSASWQWVAGCGADAAPYFRIFNPVTQSEKFDTNGDYIRQYVPELAALPNKWIHKPWEAPASVLAEANVEIGHHYPAPIVDLKATREAALAALSDAKARFEALA